MKKRVFIAYRFTGEDPVEIKKIISQIGEVLESTGYSFYCAIFDSDQFENENWSGKKILGKVFKEIDNSDLVLFFVNSSKISQGMLVELGFSLAKNKEIILAIKKDITDSIFRRQIENVLEFENLDDLKKQLTKI